MKEIQLTQGKVAIIDDEDYERVSQYKWHYIKKKCNSPGYASHKRTGEKAISMHGFILNAPEGMEVDHRSGETLDNRKENLRICTHAQNSRNIHKRKESLSKYKGLSRGKGRDRWQVQIGIDGKHIHIGMFSDEIEAAKAYDAAARFYFGEFAQTNFDGDLALSAQEIKELPRKAEKSGKAGKAGRAREVRRQRIGKTSIYRGVRREKGKWKASIYTENYKKIHIGTFKNELDAAHTYDVAAKELYGESARLNFPEQAIENKEPQTP